MSLPSHLQFNEAELEVAQSAVLAAKRLFDATFTETLVQLSHWRIDRLERKKGGLLKTIAYYHNDFAEDQFESFAMRLRPFWFDRDACALETKILPLLRKLESSNELIRHQVDEVERFWFCRDIRSQIANRTPPEVIQRTGSTDLFDIIFGGSDWIDESFFDEVFLYGGLYHWNSRDKKWKRYQEIQSKAGGYKNVVASVLPFFRRKLYAIVRAIELLEGELRRLSKIDGPSPIPGYLWTASCDESQHQREQHNLADIERSKTVTPASLHESALSKSAPILDILALAQQLPEGEFIEQRTSLFLRNGDLKFRIKVVSSAPLSR